MTFFAEVNGKDVDGRIGPSFTRAQADAGTAQFFYLDVQKGQFCLEGGCPQDRRSAGVESNTRPQKPAFCPTPTLGFGSRASYRSRQVAPCTIVPCATALSLGPSSPALDSLLLLWGSCISVHHLGSHQLRPDHEQGPTLSPTQPPNSHAKLQAQSKEGLCP